MGLGAFLTYKALKGGGGGDSNLSGFKLPEFQTEADYTELQKYLKNYGMGLMEGNVPDYYKALGETNSPEFNAALNLMKGDVASSVESSAAATGRRGGVVSSVTAQKTGELTTKMRYADYLRSLQGKQYLMGAGIGLSESARSAAQAQQGQKNTFALNRSRLDMAFRQALDNQDEKSGEALGNLLSFGIDAIGGAGGGDGGSFSDYIPEALGAAAGFIVGGPAGAMTGYQIGSKIPDSWLGGGSGSTVPPDDSFDYGAIDINDYMLKGSVA